jgi:hypothetical protein
MVRVLKTIDGYEHHFPDDATPEQQRAALQAHLSKTADRTIADFLASQGRHGDTMLAHINPEEAALLKARGGAGTINPNTGLPEYYDGSENDRGIGDGGGPSGSTRDSDSRDNEDKSSRAAQQREYAASMKQAGLQNLAGVGSDAYSKTLGSFRGENNTFVEKVLDRVLPIDISREYNPLTKESYNPTGRVDYGELAGSALGLVGGMGLGQLASKLLNDRLGYSGRFSMSPGTPSNIGAQRPDEGQQMQQPNAPYQQAPAALTQAQQGGIPAMAQSYDPTSIQRQFEAIMAQALQGRY